MSGAPAARDRNHRQPARIAVAVALAAAVLAVLFSALVAPAAVADADDATNHDRHPRTTAEEVCESMVRDSVVAAARKKLATPRTSAWHDNEFTCTYSFGRRGALVVTVDVLANGAQARQSYRASYNGAAHRATLFGFGQRAYRSGTDLVIAQKDRFLLTVDGRQLASSLHPDSVTWSASRAIFDCW